MGIPGAGPSRRVAAILSFIIPGLGQMYLGKVGRGFVYLLSTAFCYAAAIMLIGDANRMGEPGRNSGIIGVFMLLGLAIPIVSTFGWARTSKESISVERKMKKQGRSQHLLGVMRSDLRSSRTFLCLLTLIPVSCSVADNVGVFRGC